jgi:hypothetical protein
MTTNGNNNWFSISGIFRMIRGKPVVIQVIDKITNAVNKTKMMMAMFELHRKYFEDVDFDSLFLDILDPMILYPSLLYTTSYLEISAEIINDEDITDYKLQKILLNWIYNEPFFKIQIIMETPEAEIELPPPIVDIIVQQM